MDCIIAYFPEFKKNAQGEIAAIDPKAKFRPLGLQLSFFSGSLEFETFAKRLKDSSPIFVRHIMPVHEAGIVQNQKEEDLQMLLDKASKIACLKPGDLFSVQCRIVEAKLDYKAKDIEVLLGTHFEKQGCIPTFSDKELQSGETYVISVLIFGGEYFLGFSRSTDNLNSHCDEYRVMARAGEVAVSRAENKLKEAIHKFGVKVTGAGNALDIGAAPGGWSNVLASYGFEVFAVDPGELHKSLYENKKIRHYRDRIENVRFEESFELVVCDMNTDPQITAEIMVGLSEKLAEEGLAIITLKLPFYDVERSLGESAEILKRAYDILAVKNLTHNRREVTALLKKRHGEKEAPL